MLGRRPGVERVEASPIVQTATLVLDPARSFLADLRRHLEEYGLHSAGQSVPHHICGPLMQPAAGRPRSPCGCRHARTTSPSGHHHPDTAPPVRGGHAGHAAPGRFKTLRSPHE